MFSSTGLESCKSKQTYFGIMSWLPGTRLTRVRLEHQH
jgi:hypothetical protein